MHWYEAGYFALQTGHASVPEPSLPATGCRIQRDFRYICRRAATGQERSAVGGCFRIVPYAYGSIKGPVVTTVSPPYLPQPPHLSFKPLQLFPKLIIP